MNVVRGPKSIAKPCGRSLSGRMHLTNDPQQTIRTATVNHGAIVGFLAAFASKLAVISHRTSR